MFFAPLLLSTPIAVGSEVIQPQEVRALPGEINDVPFVNSNSPELVNSSGILLSTFPRSGKTWPKAHLDYALEGEFYIFSHHVTRRSSQKGRRSLYHGILLHNTSDKPAQVEILQAASYLSSAHAPFISLPEQVEDPSGKIFSGPGSRLTNVIVRGQSQEGWTSKVTIPPGESHMMVNRAIPPSNTRTTWMKLSTDQKLYVASMAKHGSLSYTGPSLAEWKQLLAQGNLIQPRDRVPSLLDFKGDKFIYGRVSGVSKGSEWKGTVTDGDDADVLKVPKSGKAFSYVMSSLHRGTFGTEKIQSAPMLARYEDTAYLAHGNYGLKYHLNLPLYNSGRRDKTVTLSLQTPLKEDQLTQKGLRFLKSPSGPICFRGAVKLSFPDGPPPGIPAQKYFHLVQRCGQQGKPLVTLPISAKETQNVTVELLYPPDSTPPQVLTIETVKR